MVDIVHGIVVQLHPVAAFSIVDSHERRGKEKQRRTIGSLLGVKDKGVYEVSHKIIVSMRSSHLKLKEGRGKNWRCEEGSEKNGAYRKRLIIQQAIMLAIYGTVPVHLLCFCLLEIMQ